MIVPWALSLLVSVCDAHPQTHTVNQCDSSIEESPLNYNGKHGGLFLSPGLVLFTHTHTHTCTHKDTHGHTHRHGRTHTHTHTVSWGPGGLPEHVVVAVDLGPLPRVLQDAPVADHGTAEAARAVPPLLPVVKHLVVGREVEDRERGVQG